MSAVTQLSLSTVSSNLLLMSLLPYPLDPALREPFTLTAFAPLLLSFYALSILAILPNTFILKLLLLPFVVRQAWSCAVGLNFSMWLAPLLGLQSPDRLNIWNFSFVVRYPVTKFLE